MKPTVLPPPLRKRGRPKKVCPSPIMQTFSSSIGSTQMHDSTPISQGKHCIIHQNHIKFTILN
jgi:hypothetical protein